MNLNKLKIGGSHVVLSLLLLGGPALGARAEAQSAGTFIAAGEMTTRRFGHTATLLPNGKVLITGGRTIDSQLTASAELYDPSTGTFSVVGQMATPRGGHTATLLANGRVLIAGGTELPSSELFDPATGTFTAAGNMTTPRGGHTATLLADGRVLFAGVSTTAELYDPSTGSFTATGNMHRVWYLAGGATLLADGTVMVGAEVYNPFTGQFTDTGHPGHDFEFTTTLLANGTAFFAGGGDADPVNCISQTELYDPAGASFAGSPKMTVCRFSHTATFLPSGIVMIAGGASYDTGPYQANLASVEIYDFSGGAFGWIGNMIAGRQAHTATLLLDGRVLIAGGVGEPGYSALATTEIYTPQLLVHGPVLFSLTGDGQGQGAIWHAATGQLASPSSPAVAGEALAMYTTSLNSGGVIAPQVAVGGRLGEILYFGNAPGYPGYYQVNFRVPDGVTPGTAVSVRLNYLGRPTNEVTIGVR